MSSGGLITDGAEALATLEAGKLESSLTRLVRDLNAALASGKTEVCVPARLAGGRMGWSARCGVIRSEFRQRLDACVRDGRIDGDVARTLVVRYGLEGWHGTAQAAREVTALERQATSNRVNAALRALAADLALHPLAPVDAPDLATARREAIVVSVLAQLAGGEEEQPLRNYIHARIRSEILGHQVPRLRGAGDSAARQRWHREIRRWEASVEHHLDENRLASPAFLAVAGQPTLEALNDWLDDRSREVRTLPDDVFAALLHFFAEMPDEMPVVLGPQQFGFAMLRAVGPTAPADQLLWFTDRHGVAEQVLEPLCLMLASTGLAERGYPHIGEAAACRAERSIDASLTSATWQAGQAALADLRVDAAVCRWKASFAMGPHRLRRTRSCVEHLAADLRRFPRVHRHHPTVVLAQLVTEMWATLAGAPAASTIEEAVAPVAEWLPPSLAEGQPHDQAAILTELRDLAGLLGDDARAETAQEALREAGFVVPPFPSDPRPTVTDELRCGRAITRLRWGYPPVSWLPNII